MVKYKEAFKFFMGFKPMWINLNDEQKKEIFNRLNQLGFKFN